LFCETKPYFTRQFAKYEIMRKCCGSNTKDTDPEVHFQSSPDFNF
jgi:hypothetical protein